MAVSNKLRSESGIAAKMIDASSETGAHRQHELTEVLKDWSLQVVATSTDVLVTLDLSPDPSTGATFDAALTWAATGSQVSGDIVTLADTPAKNIRCTLVSGASSDDASAWVCGR